MICHVQKSLISIYRTNSATSIKLNIVHTIYKWLEVNVYLQFIFAFTNAFDFYKWNFTLKNHTEEFNSVF